MRRLDLALLAVAQFFGPTSAAAAFQWQNSGSSDFANPPKAYRPKFRYWLPDASVSSASVADDIKALASVGAGLEFLPFYLYGLPGPPDQPTPTDWSKYGFGSDAFVALFKDALKAVRDADVPFDAAQGANQGQGVPSEPGTPGLSMQLSMGNISVLAGHTYSGIVPPPAQIAASVQQGLGFQHSLELFSPVNLTAVLAIGEISTTPSSGSDSGSATTYLNESSALDITSTVRNGEISWTSPSGSGQWRIMAFWQQYTGQRSCLGGVNANTIIGNGSWTVDHFSALGAKRVTDFWDSRFLSDAETASLMRDVIDYAWEDSMEILATAYWTDGLLSQFEKDHGYSLVKYLPLIFASTNSWNGIAACYSEQFVYGDTTRDGTSVHNIDYRTSLNKGYQAYLQHFAEWSKARGFGYSAQPAYNLPLEMLDDIPILDAPEGESLGFGDVIDAYRQFRGPAHLAGRNVISTEIGALPTGGFSLLLPELLWRLRYTFAGGFTANVLHGYSWRGPYPNTTWPGYVTFGFQFTEQWSPTQPAWLHIKDTLDWIARNQWVTRQGVPQVDLAIYLYESPWKPSTIYNNTNLLDAGWNYDYLGPENLGSANAVVENGVLAPGGPAYKGLVFLKDQLLYDSVIGKAIGFANTGLKIFVVGNPEVFSEGDMFVQTSTPKTNLLQQLLATKNVHRVASNEDLPAALATAGLAPRVSLSCSSANGNILSTWRHDQSSGTDYVLFYNNQVTPVTCTAVLKASSPLQVSVLNTWTGTQEPLVLCSRTRSGISIPLNLAANETVTFALSSTRNIHGSNSCTISSTSAGLDSISYSNSKLTLNLASTTTITYSNGRVHTPLQHLQRNHHTYPQVADWKPWLEYGAGFDAISGVGRYTTTFTIPASTKSLGAILHLGPIVHTMRAFINGKQLPVIDPARPQLDISGFVQGGKGRTLTLLVEVTTPLFNRVKADAANILMVGRTAADSFGYADAAPQEYGLLGPVWVQWVERVDLGGGSGYGW